MAKDMLTCEVLAKLSWVTEDQLRSAIRRGHLRPDRMANGLFIWPPKAVAEAKEFFAAKKKKRSKP